MMKFQRVLVLLTYLVLLVHKSLAATDQQWEQFLSLFTENFRTFLHHQLPVISDVKPVAKLSSTLPPATTISSAASAASHLPRYGYGNNNNFATNYRLPYAVHKRHKIPVKNHEILNYSDDQPASNYPKPLHHRNSIPSAPYFKTPLANSFHHSNIGYPTSNFPLPSPIYPTSPLNSYARQTNEYPSRNYGINHEYHNNHLHHRQRAPTYHQTSSYPINYPLYPSVRSPYVSPSKYPTTTQAFWDDQPASALNPQKYDTYHNLHRNPFPFNKLPQIPSHLVLASPPAPFTGAIPSSVSLKSYIAPHSSPVASPIRSHSGPVSTPFLDPAYDGEAFRNFMQTNPQLAALEPSLTTSPNQAPIGHNNDAPISQYQNAFYPQSHSDNSMLTDYNAPIAPQQINAYSPSTSLPLPQSLTSFSHPSNYNSHSSASSHPTSVSSSNPASSTSILQLYQSLSSPAKIAPLPISNAALVSAKNQIFYSNYVQHDSLTPSKESGQSVDRKDELQAVE